MLFPVRKLRRGSARGNTAKTPSRKERASEQRGGRRDLAIVSRETPEREMQQKEKLRPWSPEVVINAYSSSRQ